MNGKLRNRMETVLFTIKYRIKFFIPCLMEWHYGVKSKKCGFCKYGTPFLGSAIMCQKRTGCLARDMRDFSDSCDNDSFMPSNPWK